MSKQERPPICLAQTSLTYPTSSWGLRGYLRTNYTMETTQPVDSRAVNHVPCPREAALMTPTLSEKQKTPQKFKETHVALPRMGLQQQLRTKRILTTAPVCKNLSSHSNTPKPTEKKTGNQKILTVPKTQTIL